MTRRPIAVFDIDGTIFRSSLFIEVTNALIAAKIFPAAAEDVYRQAYQNWLNREGSYDDYLTKMVEAFERYLIGQKTISLEVMAESVISNLSKRTYRYTRDLIESLKATHFMVAISGSPSELVSRFCQIYGFNDFRATKYEIIDGLYTGQADLGTRNKDVAVQNMIKRHNLTLHGSIGVGDSESDISFLAMVERPIAFNPSSSLFAEAKMRGWNVVVERKDVIYQIKQ